MNTGHNLPVAFVFMAGWIALFAVGYLGFLFQTPPTKQRWLPRLIILHAASFPVLAFALFASGQGWVSGLAVLAFAAPVSAAFARLNLKANRVCLHCGGIVQTWGRSRPKPFCPWCRKSLLDKPAPGVGDGRG